MSGAGGLAAGESGAGPPLLLLNGYAATKDDWDPAFVDRLAAGSRVIRPDNPGVGESAPAPEPLTVGAIADDIVALMDARGIASAAVVGWSMGGFVAQVLAARNPERVERLALLASDGGGPEAVRPAAAVQARLRDHSGTPREQATRLLGLLFPPPVAARMDAEFGDLVAAARAELSPAALAAQEGAIDRWYAAGEDGRLASIAAPTLIAHGTEDAVIPFANAARLEAGIAGSRLVPFAGCGHAFMGERPGLLGDLIAGFLSRRPRRGRGAAGG